MTWRLPADQQPGGPSTLDSVAAPLPLHVEHGTPTCPDCGSTYIRLHSIAAAIRDREDGPATTMMMLGPEVTVSRAVAASVPGRRCVVVIHFGCEGCGLANSTKALQLMEHKGEMVARWLQTVWKAPTVNEDSD